MSASGTGRALRLGAIAFVGFGALFVAGYLGGAVVAGRDIDTVQPTVTVTSSATAGKFAPMREPVPANSDCQACHGTNNVAKPAIPRMAHPAEGWTNCTACHSDGGLVQTAPGHSGIHKEACLMCHEPAIEGTNDALPRPHHLDKGAACSTCHSATGKAPFPSTMEGRRNCWVCHPAADSARLFGETAKS